MTQLYLGALKKEYINIQTLITRNLQVASTTMTQLYLGEFFTFESQYSMNLSFIHVYNKNICDPLISECT